MTRASYVVLAVQQHLWGTYLQKSDIDQEEKLASLSCYVFSYCSGFWLDSHRMSRAKATGLSRGERQMAWILAEDRTWQVESEVTFSIVSILMVSVPHIQGAHLLGVLELWAGKFITTSEMQHHGALEHIGS